jgi:predicted ATPase/class 3 adenylate cyclase
MSEVDPLNWGDAGVSELVPTGTVTLLLADVEGSTRLWETQPQQMTAAVAQLDRTVADLVTSHHGVRPVEQGEGDSFVVAFARASDAVACALALQRAPLAPIRLRIGLHTGEVQLRDEGNYIGPTINKTGRLRDLAHGGQTVLSGTTSDLVMDRLPRDAWLADLGVHGVRDLPRPEHIMQLCHADLHNEFPPLRTSDVVVAQHLPAHLTSFVGRETQIADLQGLLAADRLVTLTGTGGTGKTRLALETVVRENERFPDGVWLCELAPLDDGAAVSHAVAAALRLQQQHGLGIEQTVIEYLRTRALLLVVDNCEHVLDAVARLLDQVVRHCPRVSVLATSREALGVEGERILPVPPLPLDDATKLFADRARACRPDFDLDHEPVGTVAEICRRLDGLPLAIELAAARIRVMSSLDVARRLDKLRLLSGGARGVHPRQQSLAATIDWSYWLLAEPEQSLFIRLSVFAGGFDLDAAHGVCGEDAATEDDTFELLTGLVDKSMVIVRSGTERSRYGVLETLRSYGRDRLRENGIEDRYATRHAVYYTELAERAAASMHSADERVWVERMLPDYDNLRAGFEQAMAEHDIDLALRLVTSLPELVHLRVGYESAGWAERVVDLANPDHPLFPAAVGISARGAWNCGDNDRARSLAALAKGRVPRRGTGRVAYPADVLADLALYRGDAHAALTHYEAEEARARRDDDPIRLVWTLFYVAICHAALRNPDAGLPAAQESVQVAEATANPTARSMARYALGLVLKKSEPDRALALFEGAAELAASVQNFWWHGIALMEAASTRAVHGDSGTAARNFLGVLDHWDRVGDWSQQWLNLRYVTRLLVRLGADEDALALHHALVQAGKPSPLGGDQLVALAERVGDERFDGLIGAEAVVRARSALARYR